MRFIKTEELKTGMRLARPIYNKNGVLLYDRDSKLTTQGILSIRNFGLIGIFVLDPAEPAPPMTKEDIEFERFQTMTVFSIQEELTSILKHKKSPKMQIIAANIIKNYGHIEKKINFIQNLRSREDYIYKHSLNTAILCAMITHKMNVKVEEQLETVISAIVHDIGKLSVKSELLEKTEVSEEELLQMHSAEAAGHELLETVFANGSAYRRICSQAENAIYTFNRGTFDKKAKLVNGAKILLVAETFEKMTAMKFGKEPESEVMTIKFLQDYPELFDEKAVKALIESINLLVPGISVELNTGDKALILTENEQDVLRPMVLSFKDNFMMDLSSKEYKDIWIIDVVKTMDNRHAITAEGLRGQGIEVSEEIAKLAEA